MTQFRTETDTFGPIEVASDRYWGAQAQRSLGNFRIGWEKQPLPIVRALGIVKLDAGPAQISVQFEPNPPIDPIIIINLIQKNRNYKLAGQDKLSLSRHCPTLADRVAAVKEMLKQLKP